MITDLWKKIKNKQFAPVYLLYGTESFLISETKQLLVESALEEGEEDFNLSLYDLEEVSIEAAIEDAETIPFMGERKLIFLQQPVFLTAEKSKGKIEHNLKMLEQYVEEPSPTTIFVFLANYEKLDERKKITKLLKKQAAVFEAKKLNENELKQWITTRARFNKCEMDKEAVERLIQLAGTSLFMLTSEIDKLALYATDSKLITAEMVESLVAKSLEQNIFSLVDKVITRKINEALRIYYDLLKQNEEPLKILSVITMQFRLVYQVKELARKGYSQQAIAGVLKVHPFRVKLAAEQAKYFADEELVKIISLLADADFQMKTGAMHKEMVIEMVLFQMNTRAK